MFNLEQAIAEWRRQMLAAGIKTPSPMDELEGHLREDVERQMQWGKGAEQAFQMAAKKIGEADTLKSEFGKMTGCQGVRSRKHLFLALGSGLGALMIAAALCYFVILPLALRSGSQYAAWTGLQLAPSATATKLFAIKLTLGTGFIFTWPFALSCLFQTGLLNSGRMLGFRRYMIVINVILAALLTTPEVVTQFLMFVPLQLLYEASIWVVRYWEHNAKKRVEN
jgi:hypothetical protein